MKSVFSDHRSKGKPIIVQHYVTSQVNNGGPATGATLLMKSYLKEKYNFIPLKQTFAPHGLSIKLFWDLYKQIKKSSPEIIHIRGLQSDGFYGVLAGKMAGCKKIVLSVHGLYSDSTEVKGIKKWVFSKLIEPLTLKMADLVYCVCEHATNRPIIKSNAVRLFGYIHNAAPDYSNYINNKNKIREEMRGELNISRNDVVVITVSRITKDKGFQTLVEAIKKTKDIKNLKYIIVGEGPYLTELKEKLSCEIQNEIVKLIGKSEKVPELLIMSDIFVLPSLHENLSNALLEACSASLPCITTKVGGNPEVVVNNTTGILINPLDSDQLTSALEDLIGTKEKREVFGINAKKRMDHLFSKEIIFGKISEMYDSLLKT
jgi:glycosyltransferase involved in cell wall biosynthesis